jgi:glycosyltransferase involved in cell wall biosynthesis
MRHDYVLSAYPLSKDFRTRLEEKLAAEPEYLTLSELRALPLPAMLRRLRSLGAERMFLPLEDGNAAALLPLLRWVAALSDARAIESISPAFSRTPIARRKIALSVGQVMAACWQGLAAKQRCQRQLRRLRKQGRVVARAAGAKRVLYLKTNLWFGVKAGGSVGHIAGVVNDLAAKGYAIDFASAEAPIMVSASARVWNVAPPRVFGLPSELNYYRFHLMIVDRVMSCVKEADDRADYDFIYQRLSIANYSGVMLSRLLGCPLVLEYNGSEAWAAKNWGTALKFHDLAVQAETVCLQHAHLVVTVSEVLRDELIERGIDKGRIVYHPNGFDPVLFDPNAIDPPAKNAIRNSYGACADAVVVTFIGTFGQWHGAEVLAQAICRLAESARPWLEAKRVHFALVGDGKQMPLVRGLLNSPACRPFCTLVGLVPQHRAPAYLAAADVLVSPHVPNADGSRFFGSPTKLFEYMAMGKGIVASRLEQIEEVLSPALDAGALPADAPTGESSERAVLAEPGSVEELVRALKFLIERENWRRRLGQNARRAALENYTWQHHVEAILVALDRRLAD